MAKGRPREIACRKVNKTSIFRRAFAKAPNRRANDKDELLAIPMQNHFRLWTSSHKDLSLSITPRYDNGTHVTCNLKPRVSMKNGGRFYVRKAKRDRPEDFGRLKALFAYRLEPPSHLAIGPICHHPDAPLRRYVITTIFTPSREAGAAGAFQRIRFDFGRLSSPPSSLRTRSAPSSAQPLSRQKAAHKDRANICRGTAERIPNGRPFSERAKAA